MLKIYIFILLNMTKHLYNITIPIIAYSLGKVLYNMKLKRNHSSYPLLIPSLKVNCNSNIAYMVTSSSCILNHSPVLLALIKHTSVTVYPSSDGLNNFPFLLKKHQIKLKRGDPTTVTILRNHMINLF